MENEIIQERIRDDIYFYSHHAEIERKADELTFAQVRETLLNGKILEHYPDTGRGESCLIGMRSHAIGLLMPDSVHQNFG